MNIFVTSPCPVESAVALPDKLTVRMRLECCQMLSIVASKKWGYNSGWECVGKDCNKCDIGWKLGKKFEEKL